MSNYIIDRAPKMYGGHQQDYKQRINEIVNATAQKFRHAIDTRQDLLTLFHNTLANLAEERHQIALQHKTEDGEYFGIRRDKPPLSRLFSITTLGDPYDEYNHKLLKMIAEQLRPMTDKDGVFVQMESTIETPIFSGRDLSFKFSVYNASNGEKWAPFLFYEEYKRLCQICEIPGCLEEDYNPEKFLEFTTNIELANVLNKKSPEDYQKLKISNAIFFLKGYYDEICARDWVLITRCSEADKNIVASTEYIVPIPNGWEAHAVDGMLKKSTASIIHQDLFLIESTLNHTANIFKQTLECDENAIDDLKLLVAQFEYFFADVMPFKRGSAAISEIFEKAIYQCKGYQLDYSLSRCVNLEALTLSEEQFVKDYDSMISLMKTQSS